MTKQVLIKIDYNDADYGAYYFDTQEIIINPILIMQDCAMFNTDFTTLLMHVINHEYLHYVLIMDHGYDVCIGLDKLVYDRRIEKKNWDYWLS